MTGKKVSLTGKKVKLPIADARKILIDVEVD